MGLKDYVLYRRLQFCKGDEEAERLFIQNELIKLYRGIGVKSLENISFDNLPVAWCSEIIDKAKSHAISSADSINGYKNGLKRY